MGNIQSHDLDPVLDREIVLSLVRRHVPDARLVTGIDETGGEARTYAIDEHIILKTQRPHKIRPKTSLEKEAFFLRELEKYPRIRVPRVYGYGREGSIEYTVMSRIPGTAVKYVNLTPEAHKNMLIELGKTLRLIHGIAQQPLIESELFPGDNTFKETKIRLGEDFEKGIARIASRGGEAEAKLSLRIAQLAMSQLPDGETLVALHANPATTHTFVDPGSGLYTGTIDFGDAYISHPVFDLKRWGLDDRKVLFSGYVSAQPVSDNFLRIWNTVYFLDSMNNTKGQGDLEDLLKKLPMNQNQIIPL